MEFTIQDYREMVDELNHEQCKKLCHQTLNTIEENYNRLEFLLDVQEALLEENTNLKEELGI